MNANNNLKESIGLENGGIAPNIDAKDIYGKIINLRDLLENYNGILIDFFRGAF